jgi:hypothetical protein
MSGGNTNAQIGGGLLTAGLIAATVMSDGAAAPLLEEEMAAEGATEGAGALSTDAIMSGSAGTGGFTPAAGQSANLFNVANAGNIGTNMMQAGAGINALNTANNMLSPQELQAWNQGQADSFVQNPNYAPTASNITSDQPQPLVPTGNTVATNVPAAPAIPDWATQNANAAAQESAQTSGLNAPPEGTPWYKQYWNNLTDTSGKGLNMTQKGTLGAAGIATLLAMQKSGAMKPNYMTPYQPVTAQSMGLGRGIAPGYAPQRASQWGYAAGGDVSTTPGSVATKGVAPADLTQTNTALPQNLQDLMSQYGVSQQQASQGIQSLMTPKAGASFAQGGVPHLKEGSFVVPADVVSHFGNGSTDAGLQALHRHLGATPISGHGDGMSDDIHTSIDGKQPARVANGEAIVDPERVKALGKGSTDAGAKKLYAMMNKVRKARTGTTKQGKQIKADQYLPA